MGESPPENYSKEIILDKPLNKITMHKMMGGGNSNEPTETIEPTEPLETNNPSEVKSNSENSKNSKPEESNSKELSDSIGETIKLAAGYRVRKIPEDHKEEKSLMNNIKNLKFTADEQVFFDDYLKFKHPFIKSYITSSELNKEKFHKFWKLFVTFDGSDSFTLMTYNEGRKIQEYLNEILKAYREHLLTNVMEYLLDKRDEIPPEDYKLLVIEGDPKDPLGAALTTGDGDGDGDDGEGGNPAPEPPAPAPAPEPPAPVVAPEPAPAPAPAPAAVPAPPAPVVAPAPPAPVVAPAAAPAVAPAVAPAAAPAAASAAASAAAPAAVPVARPPLAPRPSLTTALEQTTENPFSTPRRLTHPTAFSTPSTISGVSSISGTPSSVNMSGVSGISTPRSATQQKLNFNGGKRRTRRK